MYVSSNYLVAKPEYIDIKIIIYNELNKKKLSIFLSVSWWFDIFRMEINHMWNPWSIKMQTISIIWFTIDLTSNHIYRPNFFIRILRFSRGLFTTFKLIFFPLEEFLRFYCGKILSLNQLVKSMKIFFRII